MISLLHMVFKVPMGIALPVGFALDVLIIYLITRS